MEWWWRWWWWWRTDDDDNDDDDDDDDRDNDDNDDDDDDDDNDDDDGDDDTDNDDDAPFLLSGPQHNMTNTSVGEIRRWIQNWKHRTLHTLIRDEESVAGNVKRSLACQQIQMNTVILSIIPRHGDKKIRIPEKQPYWNPYTPWR